MSGQKYKENVQENSHSIFSKFLLLHAFHFQIPYTLQYMITVFEPIYYVHYILVLFHLSTSCIYIRFLYVFFDNTF